MEKMSLVKIYIIDVIPYFFLGSFIAFLLSCFIARNRKMSIRKRILVVFFGGYILALLSQTVFPDIKIELISPTGKLGDGRIEIEANTHQFQRHIANIVPFRSIVIYIRDTISSQEDDARTVGLLNTLGNIAIFIPMGFFLPQINEKHKRIWVYVLISALASLFIEVCQLFIGRRFDIDDVIMNTLGACIGCLISRGISKLVLFKQNRKNNYVHT